MKKIIALYGRGGIGKTSTLNCLIGLLDPLLKKEPSEWEKDRRKKLKYQEKKVIVTTPGDNENEIKKNIEFFQKEKGDILITATRTRGGTITTLKEYAKKENICIIWIEKNTAKSLCETINRAQAEDIKARLLEIITSEK